MLAAGAGSRMGRPKALVVGDDGLPWLTRAVALLLDAGCAPVLVALGAAADAAAHLVPDDPRAQIVAVPDWADGMSRSLAAGLDALEPSLADAVAITLVDLPDLPRAAVERMLAEAGPDVLARATWQGEPGHPVIVGRAHWAALRETLDGDRGAGRYLARHGARAIECGDLGDGRDVDAQVDAGAGPIGAA